MNEAVEDALQAMKVRLDGKDGKETPPPGTEEEEEVLVEDNVSLWLFRRPILALILFMPTACRILTLVSSRISRSEDYLIRRFSFHYCNIHG
jgi:hypothetical protein